MVVHKNLHEVRQRLPWYQRIQRQKYTFLLVALVGFLLFMPLAGYLPATVWPLFFFAILITALDALELPRTTFRLAAACGLLAVTLHMIWLWTGISPGNEQVFEFVVIFLYWLFVAVSIVLFLRHIFTEKVVTGDTIKGGIAVYFLAGLAFALLFDLVLRLQPDALVLDADGHRLGELIYYSFVTLTTLGYGDIAPKTELMRTLSYMEAALGTIYLAVLISRLVGMHTSSSQDA